jgi:hypothetical protein
MPVSMLGCYPRAGDDLTAEVCFFALLQRPDLAQRRSAATHAQCARCDVLRTYLQQIDASGFSESGNAPLKES